MKKQIINQIEQFDTIIILRHMRPDPDAYGSQVGLKELIQLNYPEKKVLADGVHDIHLDYLAQQDQVEATDYEGALVIITDTGNTERIDSQHYHRADVVIKIDHHPNHDPYGDYLWVDTEASSSSELIYRLFKYGEQQKGWKMNASIARLLFAGIVGDTGRLLFPSATPFTFQVTTDLVSYPFDRQQLFNDMYEVSRDLLHLQGYLFQNFIMDDDGVAYIKITQEVLDDYKVTTEQTSQLIGSLGNVEGIRAWVIFVEEPTIIRVRLRSKGPVINELAAKYGGGGHPLASGASIRKWEEADQLIEDLRQICLNKA